MTKRRTEQPKIVAMIGASGSGKTTICNEIERVTNCDFRRVISHTTRKARPSEKDGISYYFTNKATFVNLILNDQMLIKTKHHNNFYGTTSFEFYKSKVSIALVDKIGLFELYNKFHPSQLYFVLLELPKEEAEKRLIERGDTKDIKQRMKDFELSDDPLLKANCDLLINTHKTSIDETVYKILNSTSIYFS